MTSIISHCYAVVNDCNDLLTNPTENEVELIMTNTTQVVDHGIQYAIADVGVFRAWMLDQGTPATCRDIYKWPASHLNTDTVGETVNITEADDRLGAVVTVPEAELDAFLIYFGHHARTARIDDHTFYLPYGACTVRSDCCVLAKS